MSGPLLRRKATMPKYNPGEEVMCECQVSRKGKDKELLEYLGSMVTIDHFEGNCDTANGFRNDGDWYEVIADDGVHFMAREIALHRLPPLQMDVNLFFSEIGYKIPERKKKQHHG